MELPFAGVHQLCAPMFARLDALPEPQRDALSVALGRSSGGSPDRFLVALAVLSLLSAVPRSSRCSVSLMTRNGWTRLRVRCSGSSRDGYWRSRWGSCSRSRASEQARARGPARVAARRAGGGGSPCLLASAVPGLLDARPRPDHRRDPRKPARSAGAASERQRSGAGRRLPAPRLGRSTWSYRGPLPAARRRLASAVAAADSAGCRGSGGGRDASLARSREAGDRGERTGSSPGCAASGDRSAGPIPTSTGAIGGVPGGLAWRPTGCARRLAIGVRSGGRRRSPSLASRPAAAGPDEDVAAELEHSAGRAQARAASPRPLRSSQRAVALTRDPKQRTERALAAADFGLRAGASSAAREMMAAAEIGPLRRTPARAPGPAARRGLLRSESAAATSAALLRAAKTLESLDAQLARETYLDAWSSALVQGALASPANLRGVSRSSVGRDAGRPSASDRRAAGRVLTGVHRRRSAAAPVLERAATGLADERVSIEEVLRWGWLATAAAVMVWDYETCLAVAARGRACPRGRRAHRAGGQCQRDGTGHHVGRRVREGHIPGRRGRCRH